jgi:predicted Zn-dependent protease
MDYGRLITEFLFIAALIASIFLFGSDVISFYSNLFFNPCETPIVYSIGNIDSGFGVSNVYLLSAVKEAEQSWESNYKSNLFEYSEGKGMKINLIYDYRQDSTQYINNLDNILGIDKDLYNELKSEYDNYIVQYNSINSKLDQLVLVYNQSGYKKKNAASDLSQIRSYESQRNDLVDKINNLQKQINSLAAKYNVTVKNYNNLTESIDSEFEQGNYIFDAQNKEINIYQFDNKETLVAVLVHEMGHALGLGHSEDPLDIMYSVNAGESQNITKDDITNINNICSKSWWDKMQERLNAIKK